MDDPAPKLVFLVRGLDAAGHGAEYRIVAKDPAEARGRAEEAGLHFVTVVLAVDATAAPDSSASAPPPDSGAS